MNSVIADRVSDLWFVLVTGALAAILLTAVGPSSLAFLSDRFNAFWPSVDGEKLAKRAKADDDINGRSLQAQRSWGQWQPEDFQYPPVRPWTDFSVRETKPLPYRPFRWGPNYPINLGIANMPWDRWLELDNQYEEMLDIRKKRTFDRGHKVHQTRPGYLAHAEECLAEICSFLAMRYPSQFRVERSTYRKDDVSTWGDSISGREAGAVCRVFNMITGDRYDFVALREIEGPSWDPMKYAGLLQQDDLAVMVEDDKGEYRLQAGSICLAGSWRLEDKIGESLHDIHVNGRVPQFENKLKFSMERFFQKQKVTAPVQRYNYSFQVDDNLAWSEAGNGPEDHFTEDDKNKKHLHAQSVGTIKQYRFEDVWYRSERQTLRRMPRTGCILFTIRTYFHPVSELAMEVGVPGRLADALRSWPEDVLDYKGGKRYVDALLPKLDQLHAAQVVSGQVKVDDAGQVVGRNERTYPF